MGQVSHFYGFVLGEATIVAQHGIKRILTEGILSFWLEELEEGAQVTKVAID